ncbi:MAG: hypothetical protein M3270_11275, partial [Thermoproteota archaeon]|nr:hypothetical protein [Thermoproteota archaeon]
MSSGQSSSPSSSNPTLFPTRTKYYSISIGIVVISVVLDALLSDISDVISSALSLSARISIFSLLAIVSLSAGLYFTSIGIRYLKSDPSLTIRSLAVLSKSIKIIQFILTGIIASIILQMITAAMYYTVPFIVSISISYLSGSVTLAFLSFKFIQWRRSSSSRNFVIILLSSSSAVISAALSISIISQSAIILEAYPNTIQSNSAQEFPTLLLSSSEYYQSFLFMSNFLALAFILLTWAASAVMLKRYSRIIGRLKYWTIILAPLASTIIGSVVLFAPAVGGVFDPSLIVFRLVGVSSIISQGILIGSAYLVISRSIRGRAPDKILDFIRISAVGVTILFVSLSANLAIGAFPPFGLIAYSFVPLGAYFYLAGLYSLALSFSLDDRLRRLIRGSIIDQSGLVDGIGKAIVNQDLQKEIMSLIKKNSIEMEERTGVNPLITESDTRSYLDEVVNEIAKSKRN